MTEHDEPIAVTGVGALFPGAPTTAEFWRDLTVAAPRLTDVPRTHWLAEDFVDPRPGTPDKVPTARGGFLPPTPFPFTELGVPPSTLPATDTAQLLALVVARRVLHEATAGGAAPVDRSRIAVILGVASATELVAHMAGRLQLPLIERAMAAAGVARPLADQVSELLRHSWVPWQPDTFPGLLGNVVAGRIANRLDLGGSNYVVDAACAGSLAAVDAAIGELVRGRADLVVTGGVDTLNDILMYMCFAQTGALSLSGRCRPFAVDADGTLLGEGIGLVALRRLADAERDGDRIYAVIRGVGSSSDGKGTSIYAPLAEGQVRALRRAYARAGVSPATVGLVEAHGTGTRAGDAAELTALRQVFDEAGARPGATAIGSVKGQIGHTKAAAGSAGLIKVVLALHHRVIPPTLDVPTGPLLADGPFHLARTIRPWTAAPGAPRRAAVSALGFGGTNFHVVVEGYDGPRRPPKLRALPTELVLVSGVDPADVADRCRQLARTESLPAAAAASQRTFDPLAPARAAVVAGSVAELAERLEAAARLLVGGGAPHPGVSVGTGPPLGPVALLAPGQGSQRVGMGGDLAVAFDRVREVWDRAEPGLADRVFPPPPSTPEARAAAEAALVPTRIAQPAVATAAWAASRLLAAVGLRPAAVAGHSLGELVAVALAGGIDEAGLSTLAAARGRRVGDAADAAPGAMLAVTGDPARTRAWLAAADRGVHLANHNAPDQVVLAGPVAAVEAAQVELAREGLAPTRLPVGAAFHSPAVAAARGPFRLDTAQVPVRTPEIPVWCNATAAPYPADPDAIRDGLAQAIASPVRFADQIDAMWRAGIRVFVEVGPGSVLTGLVRRCLAGRPHLAVSIDPPSEHGLTGWWSALGQLAAAGVAWDPSALWDEYADPAPPEPARGPTVALTGANHGKPPPPERTAPAPSAPPAPAPAPTPARADVSGWIEAVKELHAPAIAAQLEYQRLMAETHVAFLRSLEASAHGIGRALGVDPTSVPAALPAPPLPPPPAIAPVAPPVAPPVAGTVRSPAPPTPPAAPLDVWAVVAAAVADKTGYPVDTLSRTQDLERDLGIDSIKRVEIVAAVRDRLPGLPELDPGALGKLATLGDVVAALGVAAPSAAPRLDVWAVVAAAVADKTGYPVDTLSRTQDLERDLGIDSIKRVEIVAAVRDRLPGLPELDPGALGKLATLGDVVAALGVGGPAPRPAAASGPPEWSERRWIPTRPPGLGAPGLWLARWVVIDDGRGVGAALVERLGRRGIAATLAERAEPGAQAVIALHGLRPPSEAVLARAFDDARAVARAQPPRRWIAVGDATSPGRAVLGGLAALARTFAAECPEGGGRSVDLVAEGLDPEQVADRIVDELVSGGPAATVALGADGARTELGWVSVTPPEPQLPLDTVWVVSGGARGVTLDAMEALARYRPRLWLLGRSPTPGDALDRLAAAGATARYTSVDLRDADAVALAVAEARAAWGPIDGVVHGAGVLADGLLERRTSDAGYDRVVGTKLGGWRALLAATASDPLRWLIAFSSVAATFGNPGQADYALANESLAQLCAAEAARRPTCRVAALGWGPWDGGMVTEAARQRFRALGMPLVDRAAGADAFVRALGPGAPHPRIVARGAPEPRMVTRASVRVGPDTHPQLDGHRVNGRVVLPLALVAEWFGRVRAAVAPDHALCDLRALRGVVIERWEEGAAFEVVATPTDAGWALTLEDADRNPRWAATLSPADDRPAPSPPVDGDEPVPAPYGSGALFHGPPFRVLSDVALGGGDRGTATVRGVAAMGWPADGWVTDPAALDGGLQLALLRGVATGVGPTLPLKVGRVRGPPPLHGPARCGVRVRSHSAERLVVDLTFTDADGALVGSAEAVELYRRSPEAGG